ncbi:hypothetical protein AK812_SmicGene3836 [Symbiodinium microadriaticum]|uniref:PPPDE domain-containing protein n=1 Tax=Symbiodinium microadriaticum TaxID=2951 RepID=A0A1Q9EY17_SYMMI|nr:hypothetical protein AK812_SmicGene3836 [Symbiodinium microadriaticum]
MPCPLLLEARLERPVETSKQLECRESSEHDPSQEGPFPPRNRCRHTMVLLDWLNELAGPCCITGPCFNCPGPASKGGRSHRDQILRTLRSPGHEVELAISPIGRMRGLAGYHSSLLIAGEEYYFSPTGIHCYPKIYSHPDEGVTKVFIGLSEAPLVEVLETAMADVEAVFGFGSNSVRQLRGRLEDPEITGFPARVRDYALAFCGPNRLIQQRGQVALGTVVYLSGKHMDVLDGYEGVPYVYRREKLSGEVYRDGSWIGKELWAYIKADSMDWYQPSEAYCCAILTNLCGSFSGTYELPLRDAQGRYALQVGNMGPGHIQGCHLFRAWKLAFSRQRQDLTALRLQGLLVAFGGLARRRVLSSSVADWIQSSMAVQLEFQNYEGVFNFCVCKEPKHWMTVDPSYEGDNEQPKRVVDPLEHILIELSAVEGTEAKREVLRKNGWTGREGGGEVTAAVRARNMNAAVCSELKPCLTGDSDGMQQRPGRIMRAKCLVLTSGGLARSVGMREDMILNLWRCKSGAPVEYHRSTRHVGCPITGPHCDRRVSFQVPWSLLIIIRRPALAELMLQQVGIRKERPWIMPRTIAGKRRGLGDLNLAGIVQAVKEGCPPAELDEEDCRILLELTSGAAGREAHPEPTPHGGSGAARVPFEEALSGAEMLCFLSGHFQPGSYDLLRKNCNTFTDCALYFLCGKRLDMRYKAVETLACMADEKTGILQSITRGEYSPNPEAEDFSLQAILQEIDVRWDACESDCSEDDIDAMRSQTLSLNEMRPVPPVRYSERLPEEAELPVAGERFSKLADAEVTEMVEIVVDDDTFV